MKQFSEFRVSSRPTILILEASVVKDIEIIVKKKKSGEVTFSDGETIKVDLDSATALLKFRDSIKSAPLQKKFDTTLQKGPISFLKLVDKAVGE